jgi:hypothetical protein
MPRLELQELAEEPVVLGVADLGGVLDLVEPVGALDERAELVCSRCWVPSLRLVVHRARG